MNRYVITLKALRAARGQSIEELCQEAMDTGVVPAMCSELCDVEPDGTCEHGCESLLMAVGMI